MPPNWLWYAHLCGFPVVSREGGPVLPKIFISYRREDTSYQTTTIYEFLKPEFGGENVFMDVDTIPAGVDFREYLHEAVSGCDVLLAVIGEYWIVDRQGKRRLDDARDFVRIELEAALQRRIRLIPVLVGGTTMPGPGDLPESIRDLAFRNAVQVRPGRDLKPDIRHLIQELKSPPSRSGRPPAVPPQPEVPAAETRSAGRQRVSRSASRPLIEPPTVLQPGGASQAGEVITNTIGIRMLLIPAGEFLMGSPDSDSDALTHEKPQHRVKLTRPFYLGVCAVTQEEYERVMGKNPSRFQGDPQRPVETVSWNDAVEFCRRLSENEGKQYRLPTEAEWEYACRAGTTTKWCFGDSESQLGEYAWYDENSGGTTHPVGEKKPNAWGVYDMHGNVWEWCADWYEAGYYSASPADDPQCPSSGDVRVLRGGSWLIFPGGSRSAFRLGSAPDDRSRDNGFRLARTP